eukprot:2388062-Lingulodinium_polyedra.AAC.1
MVFWVEQRQRERRTSAYCVRAGEGPRRMSAERKRFAVRPGQDERRTAVFCVRGGAERTQNAC